MDFARFSIKIANKHKRQWIICLSLKKCTKELCIIAFT